MHVCAFSHVKRLCAEICRWFDVTNTLVCLLVLKPVHSFSLKGGGGGGEEKQRTFILTQRGRERDRTRLLFVLFICQTHTYVNWTVWQAVTPDLSPPKQHSPTPVQLIAHGNISVHSHQQHTCAYTKSACVHSLTHRHAQYTQREYSCMH